MYNDTVILVRRTNELASAASGVFLMRDVFRAASDPTRRQILRLLADGPRPAGDIVQRFDVSQPAVSRHLKVLRDAGLVQQAKRGRERVYTLQPEPLREIYDWVTFYGRFWDDRLDSLEEFLDDD